MSSTVFESSVLPLSVKLLFVLYSSREGCTGLELSMMLGAYPASVYYSLRRFMAQGLVKQVGKRFVLTEEGRGEVTKMLRDLTRFVGEKCGDKR